MNYTQAIDQVRDVVVKMRYLESIDNIIYCDKWHVCPKDGFSYEADVNAYLAEIRHDQLVNDHVAQLVAYFETVDDSQYQNDDHCEQRKNLLHSVIILKVNDRRFQHSFRQDSTKRVRKDSWNGNAASMQTTMSLLNQY